MSGMCWALETLGTSSLRGRPSPRRCRRGLTRPLIHGGFLWKGSRCVKVVEKLEGGVEKGGGDKATFHFLSDEGRCKIYVDISTIKVYLKQPAQ